jgi:glyoxylase-like metal-dependent hydrolase (beta-lactamase superfamily II)
MGFESEKLEFAPGVSIERLKLPMPLKDRSLTHINVYLVEGDSEHGALLVDTGWDSDDTFAYLKQALADRPVGQIVVTHTHFDHYGLANRLKQYCNARVYMHELERDIIQSRYINMDELLKEVALSLQVHGTPPDELDQLRAASLPMRQFVTPTPPDVTLHGDETITTGYFNFKVLWTPGHAPGHICLYEPDKKILLSGDHILPTITPHVGLHPQSGGNPLGDYLASLNRLKELEVKTVLPGHEQPFNTFRSRVEAIIQHHRFRNSQILGALNSKSKTAYQIAHEITWVDDINGVSLDKLDHWNQRMAILETISHLEAMRANREVDSFSRDDIIHYQRHLS